MNNVSFIDLFAGVGGFRVALEQLQCNCVFSSELDMEAQQTYQANFKKFPHGDIRLQRVKEAIPNDFDILCGGFPCQPFSLMGRLLGFDDERANLFFDIRDIILQRRPKVVFLENVKNLLTHDGGKTFKVILDVLENELQYKVFYKVLNTSKYTNIPQNRERIFIVAFDSNQVPNYKNFLFPEQIPLTKKVTDVIFTHKVDDNYYYKKENSELYWHLLEDNITKRGVVYQLRFKYVRENKSGVCPTLIANMGTGGNNVPIILDDYGIRKLTPRECFLLQGFPMDFVLPSIGDAKLYKQCGNSVTVPLIKRIAGNIIQTFS